MSSFSAVFARLGRGFARSRRALATVVTLTLLIQVAGYGTPAYAVDGPSLPELRELAVRHLIEGGPSVQRAAEAALLGSDDDLRAYYESGAEAAEEADGRA